MSFAKRLKRAFGFSDSEMDEEELEGIDARVTPLRDRREQQAALLQPAENASASLSGSTSGSVSGGGETPLETPCEVSREGVETPSAETLETVAEEGLLPDAIFESVVKIFNESLPDFLRNSVDEQSQREYLYRALDSSMKEYIAGLDERASRRCDRRFEDERRSMHVELESMRRKMQQDETDCSESKKLQLSAERQKRALNERLHDMEKQLDVLKAENEQYVLENKSLLNKLRVSAVTGCSGEMDDALVDKFTELVSAQESLTAELAAQKELTDKAEREAKENLMALDMNRRKLTETVEKWQADTAAMEQLQADYGKLQIEAGALREELADANDKLKVIEQMNEQLDSLEEARKHNTSVQRQQKDEIMAQAERIAALEKEKSLYAATLEAKENSIRSLEDLTESLRKTIESNLYEHAQSESVLRSEINRLNQLVSADRKHAEPYTAPQTVNVFASEPDNTGDDALEVSTATGMPVMAEGEVKRKTRRGRKPKVKISAIDDTLENTDWLLSTPPVSKKVADKTPDEFGYREPDRKVTPDHPAQMSLF